MSDTSDTAPAPGLITVGLFEWLDMVRVGEPLLKRAAFFAAPWIGLYADTRTGAKVHPGHKRLRQYKMSDNTITAAFRDLVANGFLRCVFRRQAGDPRDLADEYELTYPEDLEQRLTEAGVDAPLMLEPLERREADTHAPEPGANSEPGHTDRSQNLKRSGADHGGHLPMDHLSRDSSVPSESFDRSGSGPSDRSTEKAIDTAVARLGAAAGRAIDRAWAARVVRSLLDGRTIRTTPAAYVARCIDNAAADGTLARLLPTPTPQQMQPTAPQEDPPAADEPEQPPAEDPPAAPGLDDGDMAPWDRPRDEMFTGRREGPSTGATQPPLLDAAPAPTPATAPKGQPTATSAGSTGQGWEVIAAQARDTAERIKDECRQQRDRRPPRRGRRREAV